eukprot:1142791-Pelagomonas_calceolata.AAC.1
MPKAELQELDVLTGTQGKQAISSKYVLQGTIGSGNFGKVRLNEFDMCAWNAKMQICKHASKTATTAVQLRLCCTADR